MKLRILSTTSVLLLLAGAASAQDRLPTKQLAGPLDEVRSGVMAPADPVDAAVLSESALIPVELTPTRDGRWVWTGDLAVDGDHLDLVLLAGGESWGVQLAEPAAERLAPAHRLAEEVSRTELDVGGSVLEGDHYRLGAVRSGTWTVSVEADAPVARRGYLLYASDSDLRLQSYRATGSQRVGDGIGFAARMVSEPGDGLSPRASADRIEDAWLTVTAPGGKAMRFPMADDGGPGDDVAGDGVFAGAFPTDRAGDHLVQVFVRGRSAQGLPFLRTAQHVVPVVAPSLALTSDLAPTRVVDARRLEISLPIQRYEGAPDRYRVFAEVWGRDGLGRAVPVSWIGGITYADGGALSLGLDLRWIGRSGAEGGFELRNLRIEDPDTFVTVAGASSLDVLVPKLPSMARAMPEAIDDEMRMGPRPDFGAPEAGGRLLLVHGYCSGNVWGPVAGQFANASIFLDTNKNRSHDAFANLIGNFGSSYSSFGIVAHSQGGAAALHLYTYYWSGLDNATGGRLIQSVGTPYQGTSLAGNAAILGQIFGIGCGTNTDLTYSGASSWLSGIPSWARNAVNYYTTSFTDKWWRPDHCNIVTDLLLSDPDDGTTERSRGQLSSGVNRGHKTGWCHTSGMRDPAQTTDSSRNSTMSSTAAN
ncbi:MAG: choice-of-anchor X domain-containing protein [Acidobacteriota bacterium]